MNASEDRSIKATSLSPVSPNKGGVYRIEHKPSFGKGSTLLLRMTWPLLIFAGYYLAAVVHASYFPGTFFLVAAAIGAMSALFLFIAYFALLSCLIKRDFILRQSGITVPILYYWAGKGRLSWSWSQLNRVVFSRSVPELTAADQVVLTFHNSQLQQEANIHIKLKEIEQLALKKLMYAIVTNAPTAVIEPPLEKVALEFPTVTGIKHLNFQSFTSLWDEEFSTRYAPTLFVPLIPDAQLRNGTITISELVACGGSAAIYAAKDSDGKQIIIKEAVIPNNASESLKTKAIELFNREALLLSKLDHPHIAKVYDHFVENEHHYEVIEYIDGLDLRRFVKERGPQPDDFVLNWAEQICEILVYLHTQDPPIIHRDLTPDNLVLRVDGQLVLIDFGAANAFVGTATGTMVGKQSYMPPEQLRGKAVPQSDIYSLGSTCYFLLTGKDPTPLEVSQVNKEKTPDASINLNPLLAKCTAVDVSDRYSSALEVLQEIRNIRQQRLIEAVSEPVQVSLQ